MNLYLGDGLSLGEPRLGAETVNIQKISHWSLINIYCQKNLDRPMNLYGWFIARRTPIGC